MLLFDSLLLLLIIFVVIVGVYKYKELSYKYKRLVYDNIRMKKSIDVLNSDVSKTLKTLDTEFIGIKNALQPSNNISTILSSLTLQPSDIFSRINVPSANQQEPEEETNEASEQEELNLGSIPDRYSRYSIGDSLIN